MSDKPKLTAEPSKTTLRGSTDAAKPQRKVALLGEHFYKFFQCPHWIWYDIYGDAEKKKETPPLLDLIYKGKIADGHHVLCQHKKFEVIKPELFRDLDEAFVATLELMKQGKSVYHGVLMHEDWVGIVDLIEARPFDSQGRSGKSNFDDWEYVVYDVQSSLSLRDDYKFQLVFYSLILERIQGVRPKLAYAIDPQGNENSFSVDEYIDQFDMTREQIEKILEGEKPAPFLKSGCKRSPWYSICLSEAQGCNDVSLIHRITQVDQRRLYDIGIKTVDDMAVADADDLRAKLEDWPFDKIVRLSNQAKSLIENEVKILSKPAFPDVKNEVYFDVESDPTHDIHFLFGVIIKERGDENCKYQYFLAKDKSEEEATWKSFLDFLAGLEDFAIYHYAYYEREVFERMAKKYGVPSELMEKFKENSIDLFLKLTDSVVMPLYFYSLKDAAGYLGYKWDDPEAGGAECVVWYNEWLEKQDEQIMNKILKYNEDDVRATLLIKEWLSSQKPRKFKEKLEEKETVPVVSVDK